MVEAALDCVAGIEIKATTVRAVAARAGVCSRLVRHYCASEDRPISASYRRAVERTSEPMLAVISGSREAAHNRLASFVAASLSGPNADPRLLPIWATSVSQINANPDFTHEHRVGCATCREATEDLTVEIMKGANRVVSGKKRSDSPSPSTG